MHSRARMRVCARTCVHMCCDMFVVCMCMHACIRACVRVCVRACMYIKNREIKVTYLLMITYAHIANTCFNMSHLGKTSPHSH